MWIYREIINSIEAESGNFIQILIGPRQAGKSSVLSYMGKGRFQDIEFDDLQLRNLAEQDPALFLSQYPPPLNLDEVQYVPNLFPELKKIVDQLKKENLLNDAQHEVKVLYRLTGSNLILLSKNVRESLVGRARYFYLNTLSVSEIKRSFPKMTSAEMIFKGGWPELYTNEKLTVVEYLNDYISNYVQKDVAQSAGIEKQSEFSKVLGLIAARVGQLVNYSEVAKDSGVKSVTIKEWLGVLSQSQLTYLLLPYESNLNTRLIKSPKIFFWDTGLATRLQGWGEQLPMLKSPYVGSLFENLVLSEILKLKLNHMKNWPLYFWRTKEGEEVDFIIEINPEKHIAIEAKWSLSHGPVMLPKHLKKDFPSIDEIILVVPSGEERALSSSCRQIPIDRLAEYLLQFA